MRQEIDKSPLAMSRRRRAATAMVCLLATGLLVYLDNYLSRHSSLSLLASGEQARGRDVKQYHGRTFTVTRVLDGDTLDINSHDGWNEYTRIRLLGIDTPETISEDIGRMLFAARAAGFTEETALGRSVTVYLDRPGPTRGKYGRLLAYVRLSDDRSLNELLLTEGLAYADLRFDHSLYNKYKLLETAARNHRKGLWETVTRDQLPNWLQEENPNLLR